MASPNQDKAAQTLYPPHVIQNVTTLFNIKYLSSCFAGAVAGVLGLENWAGFTLFALTTLITSALLYLVKCRAAPQKYVHGGLFPLVNPGADNIFSFILVWTLFYGMHHTSLRIPVSRFAHSFVQESSMVCNPSSSPVRLANVSTVYD